MCGTHEPSDGVSAVARRAKAEGGVAIHLREEKNLRHANPTRKMTFADFVCETFRVLNKSATKRD
jgi:hypothetical protein